VTRQDDSNGAGYLAARSAMLSGIRDRVLAGGPGVAAGLDLAGHRRQAVRHAQAAQDWERAGRLLADHWLDLTLNGQAATAHQLITSFPADAVTANAQLTAVAAAAELMRGSLEEGARYLASRPSH
jgi:ATP/maltotriose-dependent transcriptional regulator MalT